MTVLGNLLVLLGILLMKVVEHYLDILLMKVVDHYLGILV